MALNNEVIIEEIEALQAIMMDEVDVQYSESGCPIAVKVTVTPATAQNVDEQHVRVTLIVSLPNNYPDESPLVTLRNPKGIDEDVLIFINRESRKKCEEYLGFPVIYELIELVRENLTANNTPSCPCAICLFHFTEQDIFSKTSCFHYFHSFCLGRYILNCEEIAAAEEEQNQQPVWMTREKRQLLCPVCREPLQDELNSSKLLENPPPEEGELLEDFSPDSPEIKELQERMANLYMQQKAKGGIIDLEEEKNRFLISAAVENTAPGNLHSLRNSSLHSIRGDCSSGRSEQGRGTNAPKKKSGSQYKQTRRDVNGGIGYWNSGKNPNKRGGKSGTNNTNRNSGNYARSVRSYDSVFDDRTKGKSSTYRQNLKQSVSVPETDSQSVYSKPMRNSSFKPNKYKGPSQGGSVVPLEQKKSTQDLS